MSDGSVQIIKIGEVIGATQLTEGELIVEAGGRAESTVVTGVGWLKVVTGRIAKYAQHSNSDMLSVSDSAAATDIVQSEGSTVSLSMLATANGRRFEGEFNVDEGYACGLLLENGGNLRALRGRHAEKIIPDQEGGLLVSGTTSTVVVDEGGGLLVYPDRGASNYEINQGGVLMLAGKANDTLFADGTTNNLGDEDSDTIVENGVIYRLGTDDLQFYSSGKAQNLFVNVGGRVEARADMLENAAIQGGTMILLLPTSASENFIVEEDHAPAELTSGIALLDGTPMIISYGANLQQLTITIQQDGVLILDGNTVKGDSVTFSAGNISLNGGKLRLITDAATQVHLKVKRLRGKGAICLQISAREISPDFIDAEGEVTGDIHVRITDANRQILYNVLKLQPDEDRIGAALQPA